MRNRILSLLFFLFLVVLAVLFYKDFTTKSKQISTNGIRINLPTDSVAVQLLSAAVQIPTVSYDEPGRTDTNAFDSMQRFLQAKFPLVNSSLERILINRFSVLYKWKGQSDSAKPILLYAHLDVVPVEAGNKTEWLHPPFSGTVADSCIWGRGTLDDKVSVVAILTAAEHLLAQHFIPRTTIYIVFGHDEEIGGKQGAGQVALYLQQQNIHTAFNLDEGGMCATGIVPFVTKPVVLVGTAEKGYLTLELKVKIPGGHSSKPEKETATGVLADVLSRINHHPFAQKPSAAVENFIDYMGPEMKQPMRFVFTNKWLFRPLILRAYGAAGSEGGATTRTTAAITIINAGVKENLIPSEATAKVNCRILTGETVETTIKRLQKIINEPRVQFTSIGEVVEPSSVSSTASFGFQKVQQTAAKVFPDALVTPFLMIGATDSKHFVGTSDNLLRCLPLRMDKEQLHSIHGVNEHIKIADFMETIRFYAVLMQGL